MIITPQELPKRTITLDDCDTPLKAPSPDLGKCPLDPDELNPETLRLELAPDKPLPPPPAVTAAPLPSASGTPTHHPDGASDDGGFNRMGGDARGGVEGARGGVYQH